MKIPNFQLYINMKFEDLLLILLPLSLVLGNFILNLNIIFIILLFLYYNLNSLRPLNYLKKFNFLIFLFIFLSLNAFFSENLFITLKGQLGLIKNIILYFALCYFFVKNDKTYKIFCSILIIVILFTVFDTFWQFVFKKDLFGNYLIESHGRRLSGPFGDEYIVGSFILKTIFFTSSHKFFKIKYSWFAYILISYVIVLLASQRMPAILFSFCLIFLFFLDKKFSYKFAITFLITIIISVLIIFSFNPKIKKHYIDRTLEQVGIYETDWGEGHKNFWDSQWGAHYLTSIEIFKDSKVFGSGIKTFRKVCNKERYSKIASVKSDSRCSTHPHNIYFEILSETGLVGIMFFLYLIISFIKNNKIANYNFIKNNSEILILTFIFFWPIQSTGSLFSTWNGFFYPLFFSYVYYLSKKYYQ